MPLLIPAAALADPPKQDVPTEADLTELTKDKVQFIDRLLTVVEKEIVPLTQQGVRKGNKLFGGAILKKSDLSTVVAVTNSETGNPLMHGEITAIHAFYEVPRDKRPPAKDCIFLCTHEPCPLCLSGITWGGWDNFFYLFSYEDTKDAFNIPHDLRMLEEIFRVPDGNYAQKNHYWSSWGLRDLIASCDAEDRKRFTKRIEALRKTYDEMSAIYQKSKGTGAEIPLK
jgi:tRNA(Arg) A34 adenosine deaminase TadA